MRKGFFPLLCLFLLVDISFSQSSGWQWAKGSFGRGTQVVSCVASDHNGNLYAAGGFDDSFMVFENTVLRCGTTEHIFVAKFSPAGNVIWATSAGGDGSDQVTAIATDPGGNIYITGYFGSDSIAFGSTVLVNHGFNNVFIAKYDSSGNAIWAKSIVGTDDDAARGIATDSSGNVYITGGFTSASISLGTITLHQVGSGGSEFFVAKYDSAGNVLWAKMAGSINYESSSPGAGIAVGESGNVYVTGSFSGNTLVFDAIEITTPGSYTNYSVFIAKYDAAGNVLWANSAGGRANDFSHAIAADADGNTYITGYFLSDTMAFGSYNLINQSTGSFNQSFFIAKYSPLGALLWAKGAGGNGPELGTSLSIDLLGNVYVTGSFNSNEFVLDSVAVLPPVFFRDPTFILKLNSNGNVLCTLSLGNGADNGIFVTANGSDNTYIGGSFGENPFIAGTDTMYVTGNENAFVAKFTCSPPTCIEALTGNNSSLQIHPNPLSSLATVQYTLPEGSKNATLIIYDILGRQHNSYALNNTEGEITINANNLSSGIYLYSLMVGGKTLATKKMAVQE